MATALGSTFKATRALQVACMVAIIGMTSNFVAQLVSAGVNPPSILIGTLSIVCIAVLYCVITVILFLDDLLPCVVSAAIDGCFLIALVVVSVIVGKPLSYLSCNVIGDLAQEGSSAYGFVSGLGSALKAGGKVDYASWIGTSKSTCLEMKSIWGLCIALCILFSLSSITSLCLWRRGRSRLATPTKGEA